ncbi:voltage-dependent anion channel [Xylogone sp. PMI_703]|nr:voltage-dependent anion channel [Xylogone sp. PMI_703]
MGPQHVESAPTSPVRIALRNFTTQWFLIPKGIGIIAVILHQLHYQFHGLGIISRILWVYTLVLWILFLILYFLRLIIYPGYTIKTILTDINETSCLASISITMTTIVIMIDLNVVSVWGAGWGIAAYVLWWINTAMSVVVCTGVPYIYVKYEPPGVSNITAGTNLPLIASLTSAAGGGVICQYGALSDRLQVPVIIVSYLMVGMGLPLALGLDTIFLTRLFDRSSPSGIQLYKDMILCGPWGQGSFALQSLGQAVLKGSFAGYGKGILLTAQAAQPIGYASIFGGLLAWGQGTFWWAFAIMSIAHEAYSKRSIRALSFGLPTWSLVFPWGVYTNAAVQLGTLMDSPAFNVWSTALTIMLVIMAIVNTVFTIKGIATGKLLGLKSGWKKQEYTHNSDEERIT